MSFFLFSSFVIQPGILQLDRAADFCFLFLCFVVNIKKYDHLLKMQDGFGTTDPFASNADPFAGDAFAAQDNKPNEEVCIVVVLIFNSEIFLKYLVLVLVRR